MDKLEKSWKDHMKAALLTAGMALNPGQTETPKQPAIESLAPAPETVDAFNVPYGSHPQDRFLSAISQLESSGGKNLKHHASNDAMHQGATAIGPQALMPQTIRNISSMLNSQESHLHRKLGPHFKDPELDNIAALPDVKMQQALKKNPQAYTRAARYLATHLNELHGGDLRRAAFGWRFGHNRPSNKISEADLKHSGYVNKFLQIHGPQEQRNVAEAK